MLSYSDVDLYAVWKPVNYNIVYHLDGGTNASGNPTTYNIESEVNFLPASKPSLYFATWLDADSNRVARIDKGTFGDIELWAVFTPEPTYFIDYYNVENARHKNPSAYTKFDLPFAFTDAKKTGYPFEGWFEDKLLTKKIVSIPDGSKNDFDIYAKWGAAINYGISYELGGGVNNPSNPSTYNIESSPILFASPSKTGANFIAWYSDNSLTKLITDIPTGSTGDTTIYAKWVLDTFDIQYVMNGGVNHPANPANYTIDSDVIQFKTPTKPGADFKGWFAEKEFANKITEISSGSVGNRELFAKWELAGYEITYELGGGTNNPNNPATYNIESSPIKFASPSKTGANFIAWYSDNLLTKKITEIPTGATGDTTIYAKWVLDTFDIQYVMNGGVNHPSNPARYTIESGKIQFESPTKQGADFKGWFSEKEFANKITEISSGSVGDRELFAKWELTGYEITYELEGGVNNPSNPSTYNIESSQILFATPSKTGANFIAWYSDNLLTKKITEIPTGSTGDTTIYAKWVLDTFDIQYVMNGGVNHPSNPANYTIDSDVIQFKTPTKQGADFKGWFAEKEFANKITEISSGSVGDRELFAKWELTGYEITYELGGGVNNPSNPSTYNIESSQIQFEPPTKTGANFIAWYSDNLLTEKITDIPTGSTGDTTIYAKWVLDTFDIQYVMNGGVNHPSNPAKYTIESEDILLEKPEKEGFFFAGWYANSAFSNQISTLAKGSIGDKTFYAKWLEIFSLNFIITTDSINPAKDIEVLINSDKKLWSDFYGVADTLLPDGSFVEYSVQMNGVEIASGYVDITGGSKTIEITIIDCYLRWWDVLFCDNEKGLWTKFEWYNNGNTVAAGETQFFHSQGGIKTGDYKLVVTAVNGNKYVWEKKVETEFPWKKLKEPSNGYLSVFPSPALRGRDVNICLSEAINLTTSVVYVYNLNGRLTKTISDPLYVNTIFLGESLSAGRYQVVLFDKINGIYETKELVIY